MNFRLTRLALLLLSSCAAFSTPTIQAATADLPDLGDSASSYVSLQEEHDLGRVWLRQLRAQAKTVDDPLITEFLENLIFRLVPHSEVKQSDFEFVVVDRAELNAFAVPGGIIGINFGILLHTRDEDELSAVLAHELAHLSQRHFARQIEAAEKQEPIAIATLLASILLIATNNPDAGFAGLVTSQAASIQSRLAYSREWEQEADRIGMRTLSTAGLDPYAMPSMFQQMLQANRYSQRPPEFLLTHPVTESRVADAADRAQTYPRKPRLAGFEFRALQNEAMIRYQLSADKRVDYFTQQLQITARSSAEHAAALYSLARLALDNNDSKSSRAYLKKIISPWRDHSAVVALNARNLAAESKYTEAIEAIDNALPFDPQDYLLLSIKASLLRQSSQKNEAVAVLKHLSELRSTNPAVWRMLGEAAGDANMILLGHRANAEYLFYSGYHAKALRQMELALQLAKKNRDFQQEAALGQRLRVMANSAAILP
ncbi:M48 family metalloprotease [Thalassolituus hydrocarboniclasticus]|uniref:M48 family metalloprotease n=1 Tax=Thalassolituus hydrocarboniclasticus TaxID=2742796 RepID=A0ABY6AAW7_9GAMM|nr:M48 family metalloprotease [Thalassolituus hydrocarboniclasticus]UXD87887.1 M48 family metalloprotease [Thalassolituus hydrocarboniclasticus]